MINYLQEIIDDNLETICSAKFQKRRTMIICIQTKHVPFYSEEHENKLAHTNFSKYAEKKRAQPNQSYLHPFLSFFINYNEVISVKMIKYGRKLTTHEQLLSFGFEFAEKSIFKAFRTFESDMRKLVKSQPFERERK